MEKYSLYQQDKLRTKSTEKKLYSELYRMLSEWVDLYDNDKSFIIGKNTKKKYNSIRKNLRKNFLHDADMKEYIKSLPNIWIFGSWHMEILFVFCISILIFANIVIG